MTKSRLEAFSDGVIAIIITIMVLELKIPHESNLQALAELLPVFVCYLLSFVHVGIYWGNHHHLLYTLHHVNGKIIWANMGLLFFLSIIPFSTGWMGENHFAKLPVAVYGINLFCCGVAYQILQTTIVSTHTQRSNLIDALKKQEKKGTLSAIIYAVSVPCAFFYPIISALLFVTVAVMWIIPDKNIESALKE